MLPRHLQALGKRETSASLPHLVPLSRPTRTRSKPLWKGRGAGNTTRDCSLAPSSSSFWKGGVENGGHSLDWRDRWAVTIMASRQTQWMAKVLPSPTCKVFDPLWPLPLSYGLCLLYLTENRVEAYLLKQFLKIHSFRKTDKKQDYWKLHPTFPWINECSWKCWKYNCNPTNVWKCNPTNEGRWLEGKVELHLIHNYVKIARSETMSPEY